MKEPMGVLQALMITTSFAINFALKKMEGKGRYSQSASMKPTRTKLRG
jgi:hypothetical protein